MKRWIRDSVRDLADRLAGTPDYFLQSTLHRSLYLDLCEYVPRLKGATKLLDAGAGRGAYADLLGPLAKSIVSVDRAVRPLPGGVGGDLERLPFADGVFDAVFCSQVLEHTPHPQRAVAELARVAMPGARAIFSIPHMSHLHNEPHDYQRLTPHGLALLLNENGWQVESVWTSGGLLTLYGYAPTTLFALGLVGALRPVVRPLLRLLLALLLALDRRLGLRSLYPQNVIAYALRGG